MTQEPGKVGTSNSKEFVILAVAVLACCALLPASAMASCGPPANARAAVISPASPLLQKLGLVQQAAASTGASGPASIVGLWHVLLVSDGQPFDEGFDAWHSDGTEILNDTAPPQPANGAGTVCLGVYKKIGPRTYKLKHPFWSFDANGNLAGSGVLTEIVTLDAGGNSYHGSFTFDLFDLSKNLIFEATGDLTAERITPD
jgi:hypothetical protein